MPQEPMVVFRGSTGLNNRHDPVRIPYDSKSNLVDLSKAVNVDIDDTYRVSRRKGQEKIYSVAAHSLFNCGEYACFVARDALCLLSTDWQVTPIRNVTIGAKMSYVKNEGRVYYANGYEKGIIENGASREWVKPTEYVGPTTQRYFDDPPIGHLLEIWNGRMLVAHDNVISYSEPFNYGGFDRARGDMVFQGRIRMMRSVRQGVWVSDTENIYFLGGTDLPKCFRAHVTMFPAIEGTDVLVNGQRLGMESVELWLLWTSQEGVCAGGPEGQMANLTQDRLILPASTKGAGFCLDGRYICTLNP